MKISVILMNGNDQYVSLGYFVFCSIHLMRGVAVQYKDNLKEIVIVERVRALHRVKGEERQAAYGKKGMAGVMS